MQTNVFIVSSNQVEQRNRARHRSKPHIREHSSSSSSMSLSVERDIQRLTPSSREMCCCCWFCCCCYCCCRSPIVPPHCACRCKTQRVRRGTRFNWKYNPFMRLPNGIASAVDVVGIVLVGVIVDGVGVGVGIAVVSMR